MAGYLARKEIMEFHDYEELMQEGPGENYGHAGSVELFNLDGSNARRPGRTLNVRVHEAAEEADDWILSGEQCYYGMKAHNGVLHPDDYVDTSELERMVEERLGFTLEEVRTAFTKGTPNRERLWAKAAIEDRLLELSEAGGNMFHLARIFGWHIRPNGCRTMTKALNRARARRDGRPWCRPDLLAAQT